MKTQKIICNRCGEEKEGTIEGLCSHCGKFGKNSREQAIEWYEQLSTSEKRRLYKLHLNHVIIDPKWGEAVLKGIELIWRKETQKLVYQQIIDTVGGEEEFCKAVGIELPQIGTKEFNNLCSAYFSGKPKQPQVDFEMLVTYDLPFIFGYLGQENENHLINIKLFFEILSKSSSFAHKAHKELNKLMK